jgi:hypothetical protein
MLKIIRGFTPHIICIFLVFYCWNLYWGGKRWDGFFLSDSGGYYAYLPATFIYHDFQFNFVDSLKGSPSGSRPGFDFRSVHHGKNIDKWFCGTAIAIAPFFIAAHAASMLSGAHSDGYSFPYAFGLSLSALFYLLAGLIAMQKILRRYFQNDSLVAFVLFLTVFATSLFYYATSEPAMSHVYSFAFINLFVLASIRMLEAGGRKNVLLCGALLGIIVLIRPVNALVVFILPFLAGSREKFIVFINGILQEWKKLLIAVVCFASILFIQMIFYKLQSGSLMIYSYGEEKMNFLKPHLAGFLFSYKKGLFVYTPFAFISLAGFIFLFKSNRWEFYTLVAFLLLLCYVLSSWWNWWYGGSFGMRPVIEFLFVFSFLCGTALKVLKGISKKIFVTACLLCLLLCQVQTFQYRYYHIHWDRMTKESYWKVFMRIDLVAKKQNPNANLME